jgi:hypothetical protein
MSLDDVSPLVATSLGQNAPGRGVPRTKHPFRDGQHTSPIFFYKKGKIYLYFSFDSLQNFGDEKCSGIFSFHQDTPDWFLAYVLFVRWITFLKLLPYQINLIGNEMSLTVVLPLSLRF